MGVSRTKTNQLLGYPHGYRKLPYGVSYGVLFFAVAAFFEMFFFFFLNEIEMCADVWRCSRGETLVDKFEDSKMGTDGRKSEDFRPLNLGNTFYW